MTAPSTATGTKAVRMSGTSMTVSVTDLCRALDIGPGDRVEVTLRRMED